MKKRALLLSCCFMIITASVSFSREPSMARHPRDMLFSPLPFSPPKGERKVLGSGMILYILEDHELPLFNLSAIIKTGSVYEPANKVGLAELTGRVMRTGGTTSMTPDEINEQLEYIAGSVEISVEKKAGTASLSVLKKDTDLGLKIFADILLNPRFDEEKLDLAKKKELEAIKRQNDDPDEIAFREFRKVLYRDNPRGRIPTVSSIHAITRKDLVDFHSTFFRPENTMLALSGDFKEDEAIKKIEKAFQGWGKREVGIPKVPVPLAPLKKSSHYAFKDIPQSTIVLGHLAMSKNDPDFYPFKVLNFILGGAGFNSRLTSEIRSNRGLAYSVGSFYRADVDYGVFAVICKTKSETTYQAISLIQETIETVKEKGVTKEELQWAKESIKNKFVFSFTSSASIVNRQMRLEFDEMPEDFLESYQENISKVTLAEIKRVSKMYLHPDRTILVVVGNNKDFETPLSAFGEVVEIELEEE